MIKMEDSQINVDEEKKLITILTYLKKITDTTIEDNILDNKRDRLVAVITNLIPQMGISITDNQRHESKIDEKLQDEMTNDIYESDPLYPHVTGYINSSKNRYLLQEQIANVLCEFIIDILAMTNDILTSRRPKTTSNPLDDGEPMMTTEQRESMKRNAYSMAVYYKNSKESVKRNMVHNLNKLCDTNEKFAIANDIFFEVTGEKVLEKYRKEINGLNTI